MKSILLILIGLTFSINTLAETICVSSAKEYEELKDKLPLLFRELPVKLGGESAGLFYDVFAVIKINVRGESIILTTDSWQGPLGYYNDSVEVKKVCFNLSNKEMTISFKNNAKDFVGKFTDKEVTLPDISLKKISTAQEKAISEKIKLKSGRSSEPSSESKTEKEKDGGQSK